jgi:TolB protein
VAGYNVYRSTSPSGGFTKLNGALIMATEYIDTTAKAGRSSPAAGAASATTYYYAVTSVDTDGDESIQSAMVSPSPAAASSASSPGSFGSGGGGCFIDTVSYSGPQQWIWLLVLLIIAAALRYRLLGFKCKDEF